ncbi:MAG TPA: NAD(P)-dependent oxidoreductase [Terriglobales bacterium]|nr:NAD(P)-dependent oxidoreductase [Terriglobales bacterium]
MRILITGAAGNLGSQVTRHLAAAGHELRLLVHKRPLLFDYSALPKTTVCPADLGNPSTLDGICDGVDCVIHLAGVLFAPRPARFLPLTNIGYVRNMLAIARAAQVRKFVLASFPHVEGETTPEHPARGELQSTSSVIHFRTRLEAEKLVLQAGNCLAPVVFRAGVVYGKGIKLVEGARWLLRRRLMAVWRKPTWVHLLALPDFLVALQAAVENERASGLYQVADDSPLTLQDFLDRLAAHCGYPPPWRLPGFMFFGAAWGCEAFALLFHTRVPLNRDIIRAGMTSSVADTSRMKLELLPRLAYPSLEQGLKLL